jgi:hypothetical protein
MKRFLEFMVARGIAVSLNWGGRFIFSMTHVWLLIHRREIDEYSVIFALRDQTSRVTGPLFCAVFLIAA